MALKVGDQAPPFLLPDTTKKLRTLNEFLGSRTIVLFCPAAFTSVCSKEMCTMRDSFATFDGLNAQIVAISVDSPFSGKAFAEQNKLNFPLLSDFTRHVSAQYAGLYMDLGGVPGYTAAKRSVFVLDKNGIVRYAWISENPGAEPNYDEIKNALRTIE